MAMNIGVTILLIGIGVQQVLIGIAIILRETKNK